MNKKNKNSKNFILLFINGISALESAIIMINIIMMTSRHCYSNLNHYHDNHMNYNNYDNYYNQSFR